MQSVVPPVREDFSAQYAGASAETFKNWWRMWNLRGEDVTKLMVPE